VFNVVTEGIAGGLQTIVTAAEGIRMQFIGTLTIEVLPVAPDCLTNEEFEEVLRDNITYPGADVWNAGVTACADGWLVGGSEVGVHDPTTDTQSGYLLHYDNSTDEWVIVLSGQDMDATYTEVDGVPLCEHSIPDSVREWIWCY